MRDRKVDRVAEFIVEKIRRKGYPPGARIESIRQMARRMAISPLTASRAVDKLVRDGWLKTHPGKGCFVALASGQETATPRTRTVTTLLHMRWSEPAPMPASFTQALERIQSRLLSQKINVLSRPVIMEPESPEPYVPLVTLAEQEPEALVTVGVGDLEFLGRLRRLGRPVVATDVNATFVGLDSVFFDHAVSAAQMVRALMKRGARRIAFIGGPLTPTTPGNAVYFDPCAPDRLEAWRAAMTASGLEAREQWVVGTPRRQLHLKPDEVRAFFSGADAPDGVVTEFADGVLDGLAQAGLSRIPVAAWCGAENEAVLRERVAVTACCDFRTLGDEAARMVLERLDGPRSDAIRCVRVPPRINEGAAPKR
jgi:DNA-binding LacI/PurR family transcriptional regulator